eukprot:scaffold34618_cov101-Isochrysis_galbana.AAC.2
MSSPASCGPVHAAPAVAPPDQLEGLPPAGAGQRSARRTARRGGGTASGPLPGHIRSSTWRACGPETRMTDTPARTPAPEESAKMVSSIMVDGRSSSGGANGRPLVAADEPRAAEQTTSHAAGVTRATPRGERKLGKPRPAVTAASRSSAGSTIVGPVRRVRSWCLFMSSSPRQGTRPGWRLPVATSFSGSCACLFAWGWRSPRCWWHALTPRGCRVWRRYCCYRRQGLRCRPQALPENVTRGKFGGPAWWSDVRAVHAVCGGGAEFRDERGGRAGPAGRHRARCHTGRRAAATCMSPQCVGRLLRIGKVAALAPALLAHVGVERYWAGRAPRLTRIS